MPVAYRVLESSLSCVQPCGGSCSAIPTLRRDRRRKWRKWIECTGKRSAAVSGWRIKRWITQARCLKECRPSLSVISAAFIAFWLGVSIANMVADTLV